MGKHDSSSSEDEYYCTHEEYLHDLHSYEMYELEQERDRLDYERALADEQEWYDGLRELTDIENMELAETVNPYRMGRMEDLIDEYDGDSDSDSGSDDDGDYCNCITCCYNDITDDDMEYVIEFISNNFGDVTEREYNLYSSISHHEVFDDDGNIPYHHFLVRVLVYGSSSLVANRIMEYIKQFIAETWHRDKYLCFDDVCNMLCKDLIHRTISCVRKAVCTSQNFDGVIDQFEEETHWSHLMREVVCHPLAVRTLCREWAEEEDHLLVG